MVLTSRTLHLILRMMKKRMSWTKSSTLGFSMGRGSISSTGKAIPMEIKSGSLTWSSTQMTTSYSNSILSIPMLARVAPLPNHGNPYLRLEALINDLKREAKLHSFLVPRTQALTLSTHTSNIDSYPHFKTFIMSFITHPTKPDITVADQIANIKNAIAKHHDHMGTEDAPHSAFVCQTRITEYNQSIELLTNTIPDIGPVTPAGNPSNPIDVDIISEIVTNPDEFLSYPITPSPKEQVKPITTHSTGAVDHAIYQPFRDLSNKFTQAIMNNRMWADIQTAFIAEVDIGLQMDMRRFKRYSKVADKLEEKIYQLTQRLQAARWARRGAGLMLLRGDVETRIARVMFPNAQTDYSVQPTHPKGHSDRYDMRFPIWAEGVKPLVKHDMIDNGRPALVIHNPNIKSTWRKKDQKPYKKKDRKGKGREQKGTPTCSLCWQTGHLRSQCKVPTKRSPGGMEYPANDYDPTPGCSFFAKESKAHYIEHGGEIIPSFNNSDDPDLYYNDDSHDFDDD